MTPKNSPSTEVLHEMVRSIKEELLPEIKEEIRNGFDVVNEKIKEHDGDIKDMRSYIDQQKGYLKLLIGLLSYLAGSSLVSWFQFFRK